MKRTTVLFMILSYVARLRAQFDQEMADVFSPATPVVNKTKEPLPPAVKNAPTSKEDAPPVPVGSRSWDGMMTYVQLYANPNVFAWVSVQDVDRLKRARTVGAETSNLLLPPAVLKKIENVGGQRKEQETKQNQTKLDSEQTEYGPNTKALGDTMSKYLQKY